MHIDGCYNLLFKFSGKFQRNKPKTGFVSEKQNKNTVNIHIRILKTAVYKNKNTLFQKFSETDFFSSEITFI